MTIDEYCDAYDIEGVLTADGFEEAIIGITNEEPIRAVYDAEKMLQILMGQGMDEDEAREYLDFNVFGAYVGPQTPLYITGLEVK